MTLDVVALRAFYDGPLGETARRFVGRALGDFLAPATGARVMGLGYPSPYLEPARGRAERVLAFMPAAQGVEPWPRGARNVSCLADSLMLPLPDGCMDRVLLVHALETSEDPNELFYEVWRVLAPGGRLAVVAPNRGGLWARQDRVPFGHGRPWSKGQLTRLLSDALFEPVAWAQALYTPPLRFTAGPRTAESLEAIGEKAFAAFGGLILSVFYMALILLGGGVTVALNNAGLAGFENVDQAFPIFITDYLPTGIGIIVILAVMSAILSTTDTRLHSTGVTTARDIYDWYADDEARREYRFFMHYAEGSAMPPLLVDLLFNRLVEESPWIVSPLVGKISSTIDEEYLDDEIGGHMDFWEQELTDRPYLTGDTFTAADIQMSFPLAGALGARGDRDEHANCFDYLKRLKSREAFERAAEKGGEESPLPG